jgi:hypothetical protein
MEAEITNNVMILVAKSSALYSYTMIKYGLYRIINGTRTQANMRACTHTQIYFVTVYPRLMANSK